MKALYSMSCDLVVSDKQMRYYFFLYINQHKIYDPRWDHFGPGKGHDLNKCSRGLLCNATHQISSKTLGIVVSDKSILHL